MDGFGVHTFKLLNKAGKETLVKFHWKTQQGAHPSPSSVWEALYQMQWASVSPPVRYEYLQGTADCTASGPMSGIAARNTCNNCMRLFCHLFIHCKYECARAYARE